MSFGLAGEVDVDPFDVDVQVESWKQILTAATTTTTPGRVYEFGEVPGLDSGDSAAVPATYTLLGVYRVPVDAAVRRYSGEAGHTLWELELSHAGSTVKEAGWLFGRACRALDDQLVTLGAPGGPSTQVGPVEFVTHDTPVLQGKRWIGRSTWSYGL